MIPRYSIIVVSYNCLANVKACIEAARLCFAAEPEHGGAGCGEIVVVDNASRDGTGEWLKAQEGLIAVLNRENRGFSAACNQGAARARGEFVLFLNPDTWAAPGCLRRMAKVFEDAKIGAVGPLSNYVAGLQRIDVQWPKAAPSLESVYASNGRETAMAIADQLARHQAGATVETKLLIGFCLMMRRSEFMAMGGMDEELFLGNDDLDLSWRLREKGRQLRVALDAFVLHEGQKSFKTERKEHVDNLVQQSTDALYRKLVRYYGSVEKVPSAAALWGMDWFKPSPDALKQGMVMQQQNLTSSLLSDISVLIPMLPGPLEKSDSQYPNGSLAEQALRETLDSLPAEVGEVLLLDANDHPAKAEGREKMRRLDIGAEMPAGMAIALAARAARKPYLLVLPAGLQMTALLNHWLSRRAPQDLGAVLALKTPANSLTVQPFILRREIWLREAPSADSDWQAIVRDLLARSKDMMGKVDMPSLALGSAAQMVQPVHVESKPQDWTPVPEDERIRLYPETLQAPLRQAKQTLFTGTQGGSMAAGAPIRGIDLSGQSVDLSGQDLIVLRVTPDMLSDLPERLKHLRRSAHDLKRLVVVFNGNHAQGIKGDARGWHVPVDLTVPGMTSALRLAGFTVIESKPYLGFPDAAGKSLQGWHQMEAIPRSLEPVLDRKVSIIILGFNQAEYTRKCLLSIRAHTRQRYELILVDNGSSDHTWDLFRSIPGAKAIRNAENLGVAAGWNCGLREATGDYVCILNNDTLVGDGWLENMVRLCESDATIGMVGPRSNRVAGPQVVEGVAYTGEESIAPFIENWNHKHALESEDHDWVKGVCMLFPKRVSDQVGFFDERFGKGNFEDDDYSLRVRLHGFRACIAHDSFLHHFGSVSFNQAGIDWTEQMRKNKALFEAKWARGKEALSDVVVNAAIAPTTFPIVSAALVAPVHHAAPVSQTEAAQGVKVESLETLTARIESAYAAGDIDAARRDLVRAADQNPSHYAVLNGLGIMSFHEGNGREAALCFLRALMAKPDFEDAAQNLIDALIAMNGEVTEAEREAFAQRFPQNPVFAPGVAEPKANPDWKAEVETAIAEQRFAEALQCLGPHLRNADTRSECFNYMGHIAFVMGQNEEALQHFQRALAEPKAVPDAVMNAVDALLTLGRLPEAVEVMSRAARGEGGLNPADFQSALLQLRRAAEKPNADLAAIQRSLHVGEESEEWLDAGNPEAARELLLKHLETAPDDFRAHNNLGLCDYYAGRTEAAYHNFLNALKVEPACGDALINACDCAISLGRVDALPEWIKRAFERDPQLPEAKRIEKLMLREGEAMRQAGSLAELEAQQEVLDAAEAKLRGGELETAGKMFTDALQRRPANPQALNGLGIMAFTQKRFEEAYARFSEAARFNPGDQDILINLWEAARAQQRETEALGFLKHSLERNPDLPDIRAIVAAAA